MSEYKEGSRLIYVLSPREWDGVGWAGKVEGLAPRKTWGAVSSQPGDATEGPSQHKCSHTSELEASRRGQQWQERPCWQSCLSLGLMGEEVKDQN